jgi:hypothetical protein
MAITFNEVLVLVGFGIVCLHTNDGNQLKNAA